MFCSRLKYYAIFICSEVIQHTLRQSILHCIHESEQRFLKFLTKPFVHVWKFILMLEELVDVTP